MKEAREAVVMAIGMFDGVHMGHRALLKHAVERGAALKAKSAVYTFSNHPRSILTSSPLMLTDEGERREAMLALGIERVFMEPFSKALSSLTPEDFIALLLKRFDIKAMVAGFNYTFGVHGSGTAQTLRELGIKHGFEMIVEPPVLYEGQPVSSTRIRASIEAGNVEAAGCMLAKPYTLGGTVVKNKRIGSLIGFPTANILPPAQKVLPKAGVYITTAGIENGEGGHLKCEHLKDGCFGAITNVGDNPTVKGDRLSVETHLLDYAGDLYGQDISIRFHARVREERRFSGKEELAAQIGRDVAFARRYFEEKTCKQA